MAKKRKKKYSAKRKAKRAAKSASPRRKSPRRRKPVFAMTVSKPGTKRHPRKRSYSFRRVRRRSNPFGGMVRIPTIAELGAVAGAGLLLPMVTTKITDFIPLDAVKGVSYGNILLELALGTAASGAVRKFSGSSTAADVVFYIVLANAVRRIARKVAPGTFGMGAEDILSYADMGADDSGVGYADLGADEPEGR